MRTSNEHPIPGREAVTAHIGTRRGAQQYTQNKQNTMDTRKLSATADGYISTEHDGYMQLVTPFREDAFRNQHGMVDEEPRKNAKELVHRWNMHKELVHTLAETLRILVTKDGLPESGKGRTPEQQKAYDRARQLLKSLEHA